NDPADGKAAHTDELLAVIDKEKRSELDLVADYEIVFVKPSAVYKRSGFTMQIEQAIAFWPRLDHSVAARYDRIAQEHVDFAGPPKDEIGPKGNALRRRSLVQDRANGVYQLGGRRRFFGGDAEDQKDRTHLYLVARFQCGAT